ncbi:MAG: hypothetical protein H6Q67_248 [Firmicutes bacterium]|nr:hypothetical protein [Bacillota bacterium]
MSKKKVLVVALGVIAMMIAMLVAGCGGASTANEIKIGVDAELTGGVASYGQSAVNGIKLAVKEINANGGVNGKQLVLVTADNKSELSEAVNAMTKLISQDQVKAVLGPIVSANVLAASRVATENRIPIITPTGTNPKITVDDNGKVQEYVFRSCFIDPFQGTVMANFASKTLKVKNAAIYMDSSSDYAKGLADQFEKTFAANGGQIIAHEAYLAKDQDFKATLTKIKATNPDVIFIPGYYQEIGLIVKQARELGITVALLGGDGWDSPQLLEIAGAAPLNNCFFSNHYSPEDKDPKTVQFIEAYKKEYNQNPEAFAALGYDAVMMLADAIKRANSDDPEKIKEALAAIQNLAGASGNITLNAQHDPIKSAVVLELKDGKASFREKVNP